MFFPQYGLAVVDSEIYVGDGQAGFRIFEMRSVGYTDLDGIGDIADNCVAIANPAQRNTDNDAEGDARDLDDDNDGVPDTEDAFPLDPDRSLDADRDGIADGDDNCPTSANPTQADSDEDGIADACDALIDWDGDGSADDEDNCPWISNPDQQDADGDGIGDACEAVSIDVLGDLVGGRYEDLLVSGPYAYAAAGPAGLEILDISDATAPVLLSRYDTAGYARAVSVADGLAFVADDVNGLRIIDVSEPSLPMEAGSYATAGAAHDVAVVGGIAYVVLGSGGLEIVDISDPAAPMALGGYTPMSASAGGAADLLDRQRVGGDGPAFATHAMAFDADAVGLAIVVMDV